MTKVTQLIGVPLTVMYSKIESKKPSGVMTNYKWFKFDSKGKYSAFKIDKNLYNVTYQIETFFMAN